jgi:hypothetical protein
VSVEELMRTPCTLVVREPGAADVYGDPVPVETLTTTTCELQQVGAREELGDQLQVTTWRLFLPKDAPARGWDAVRLADGSQYELAGDAWLVVNARTGQPHHVEAYVEGNA